MLDALFEDVPESSVPLPGRASFAAQPGVTHVPFDGPQSVIAFGHRGIPRDDPDFLTAFVVNEIVGGGRFGTRLMTELREKARANLWGWRVFGLWLSGRKLSGPVVGQQCRCGRSDRPDPR